MPLAIFDLDNTLLAGDSDFLWGVHLCEIGVVDRAYYESENARFYRDYLAGELDIQAFLTFALEPLAAHDIDQLQQWREQFLSAKIEPIISAAGRARIEGHRRANDTLLIITATNSFVTAPIAERLEVPHLIATEPEQRDGRFTGRVAGTPSFRDGKVERLMQWLAGRGEDLAGSWFYSDSHNDLPLLERVTHPVAVNPDAKLGEIARHRGWPMLNWHA